METPVSLPGAMPAEPAPASTAHSGGAAVSRLARGQGAGQPPQVTVHLPAPLRECCAGAPQLELAAWDLRGLLALLERDHAALYRCVCDDARKVRRHVNLFVNTTHMLDCAGLDTPLAPGDTVTILPAVSGG